MSWVRLSLLFSDSIFGKVIFLLDFSSCLCFSIVDFVFWERCDKRDWAKAGRRFSYWNFFFVNRLGIIGKLEIKSRRMWTVSVIFQWSRVRGEPKEGLKYSTFSVVLLLCFIDFPSSGFSGWVFSSYCCLLPKERWASDGGCFPTTDEFGFL